jgi:CRP/FNR family transcriptional regulator, cyclic AMP receptor protein
MSPASQPNGSPGRKEVARQSATGGNQPRPRAAANKRHDFDPTLFLASIGEGRKVVLFPKKQSIFAQGDPADTVFYLQTGKVKLTVVSNTGREATIGIVGEGDFFGEGSLAGQALRMGSAACNVRICAVLARIDKKAMMEALHHSSLLHIVLHD